MPDNLGKNWLKVCFPTRIGHLRVCGKGDHVRSEERRTVHASQHQGCLLCFVRIGSRISVITSRFFCTLT